jgi:hypothetical protein
MRRDSVGATMAVFDLVVGPALVATIRSRQGHRILSPRRATGFAHPHALCERALFD